MEIVEDPPTTYGALLGGKYSKWIPLTVDIINDSGWGDRTVRVIGRKEEFKLTGMQADYENDKSSKIYISAKNKSGRELNFHIEFFEIKVEK